MPPAAESPVRRHVGFRRPAERTYRADERGGTTVLIGGLTWRHHELAKAVLESLGHRCEVLPSPDAEAFHLGKDHCNNGLCNPIYFMVGSLLQFLRARRAEGLAPEEISDRYVYFTVGSCGPCRHGMYEAEYRSALKSAGFDGFRIPLLVQSRGIYGQQEDPGLEYTQDFAIWGLQALMLGDLLEDVEYQLRPYEVNPGETERVIRWCVQRLASVLRQRRSVEVLEAAPPAVATIIRRWPGLRDAVRASAKLAAAFGGAAFRAALVECRERTGAIEVDRLRARPVVKIVGEFYSQTTESFGNYDMFAFLEREGAEVIPPVVTGWVTYLLHQARDHWRARRGLVGVASHACGAAVLWLGEAGVALAYRHLARSLGGIAHELLGQAEVARLAHPFYNTLLRGGEGHQEVGKNIYYSDRRRSHMVLSLKPFGCMPSQLSDGVQSAVVERHPGSVFQAVETSGEGEIHAQSRVQMALSEAKARMKTELDAAVRLTGRTLEEIRAYTAAHPELRRAGYRAPNGHGVAGRAAAFVRHVGGLMDRRRRVA